MFMVPGFADEANKALSNKVLQQIANTTGAGKHHHHHHTPAQNGAAQQEFVSGNGTGSAGPTAHQAAAHHRLLEALNDTSGQHRMGIIVTLSFSILAALIVLYTIVNDAYKVQPGEVYSRAQKQSNIFSKLHPAEVIPFLVATAILIQGFIFLIVQALGMGHGFEVDGCRMTAELIWPAFFLVALVILTFSFETAIRGLSKRPFQPRGRFTTPVCIIVVVLFTAGLWASAFLFATFDICPGSLSWWTANYSKIGIALAGGIILTHFITGGIIIFQLKSTIDIDPDERISASRVVYSMAINAAIIGLVLPFWIEVVLGRFPLEASKVADIGITVTGMVFGAMHFFSRANAERLAIRPKDMAWSENRSIRLFGSSDLHHRQYISGPVLEPKLSQRSLPSTVRQPSPVPNEPPPDYIAPMNISPAMSYGFTAGSPTPLLTQPQHFERAQTPQPMQLDPSPSTSYGYTTEAHPGTPVMTTNHHRQPTEDSILDGYAAESPIEPPAPLFAAYNHQRQSSTATSGNIEIGLRLSRPITGMDEPPSDLSALPEDGVANDVDLEKNLQSMPEDESYLKPAIAAPSEPKKPPPPPSPPKNVGIGALGQGPKGGLRALTQHTQRTSPLANEMKADSPSPRSKRSNPFSPPAGSPLTKSPSANGSTGKSPRTYTPPAIVGLPGNPSPRSRSPAQQSPQKSPQRSPQQSPLRTAQSASIYSALQSPTEWPSWAVASPKDWPSGDQVDVPTPNERRWA